MSAHQTIDACLSGHLQLLGLPTSFENAPYTPSDGTLYVRATYLPAETQPGMAAGSSDNYSGIYQALVCAPRDGYKKDGFAACKQIAEQFPRATSLTTDEGITVRIERVTQAPGLPDGNRWNIPVSIHWRAFAKG